MTGSLRYGYYDDDMIPQGFDSKQVVEYAKALEDYVYSS